MLKKFSTLVIWALASCFAFANGPNLAKLPFDISTGQNWSCDLKPPSDFHIEDIGNTWVTQAWTPINPGVFDHRVMTYLVAGNVLISDIVVPASLNTVTVNGLISGELYYSTINTICTDGSDSRYFIESAQFRAVISDLIVTGFDPTNLLPTCGIDAYAEYCEFSLSPEIETYFEIYTLNPPYYIRQFKVLQIPTTTNLRAKVTSTGGYFQFKIDNKYPNEHGVRGQEFQIYINNGLTLVARFELYTHYDTHGIPDNGHLICKSMVQGYAIAKLDGAPRPPGKKSPSTIQEDTENREAAQKAALSFSANPNPFSETLEVTLGENTQGPVHLQLLNLSGQVVIDRREMPGLEQVTLPTAHLASGFYMLRIEAAGEVQTIKVVKSE